MTINQDTRIQRRLLVTFVPQAWINDMAIPIGKPELKDATAHLLQLSLAEIHGLKDKDASSDEFVDAIAWAHYGPYEVQAVEAVKYYFAVQDLREITQEMLDEARLGLLSAQAQVQHKTHTESALEHWIVTYGEGALMFSCQAEGIGHAIEQCENAYPGETVLGAFLVPATSDHANAMAANLQRANNATTAGELTPA